jgi:hypothetical protein
VTPKHQQAADLLDILWQGIGSEYKSRYRQTIWEQFENQVRASSYTNNLGKFANSVCSKLGVVIPARLTKQAEEILNSGEDKALLKLFRDETTLIVLMVRVRNQERREKYQEEKEVEIQPTEIYMPLFDEEIEK